MEITAVFFLQMITTQQ